MEMLLVEQCYELLLHLSNHQGIHRVGRVPGGLVAMAWDGSGQEASCRRMFRVRHT